MNVQVRKQPSDTATGRPNASACVRLDDVRKTIWLTRPDLRELCGGDRARFEWWLLLNGTREYRALDNEARLETNPRRQPRAHPDYRK
jgi:hypothetical protein